MPKKEAKDLQVLMVWLPVILSDTRESAKESMKVLRGDQVTTYWDKGRKVSQWFHKHGLEAQPELRKHRLFLGGFLWDTYILYDAKARWSKQAPKPVICDGAVVSRKKGLLDALDVAAKNRGKADRGQPRLY